MNDADTQCALILYHLKSGRSITPLEALDHYGCFRLSARVLDLRRKGHDIDRQMISDPKSGKRYAEYRLARKQAA